MSCSKCENPKYPVILSNGQRIYSPTGASTCTPPPRGSEIFVGNLPRDLFEDELVPLFSRVGPIYKLRLMMDFSGVTRGFAFVHYFTPAAATAAIKRFNDFPVPRKEGEVVKITVHLSLDNCRLFFGNIPRGLTEDAITEDLGKIVEGIVRVFTFLESGGARKKANRGYAFVEFESHAAAAIARRRLLSGVVDLWENENLRVYVDWAEPEPIVAPQVLEEVCILYFRNVPGSWQPGRFKNLLCRLLNSIDIERVYKKSNYAFVHFYSHEEAELALKLLQSATNFLVFEGKQMEVEWARPVQYSKKFRNNQLPDNFCMSVPPKLRKMVIKSKKSKYLRDSLLNNDGRIGRSDDSNSDENDIFTQINIAAAEEFLAAQFQELSLTSEYRTYNF